MECRVNVDVYSIYISKCRSCGDISNFYWYSIGVDMNIIYECFYSNGR